MREKGNASKPIDFTQQSEYTDRAVSEAILSLLKLSCSPGFLLTTHLFTSTNLP